jgi:threonine dehydrogenase-like Zn-dependent dehydrogenase
LVATPELPSDDLVPSLLAASDVLGTGWFGAVAAQAGPHKTVADLSVEGLFWSLVHLHGGPAPVRRFLPELIELIWNRRIDPGKVFDLSLPLEQAAEGYRAMDRREPIKVLLHP